MSCAPCTPVVELLWTDCDDNLVEACGWLLAENMAQEPGHCSMRSSRFATQAWPSNAVPQPGELVTVEGSPWYVRSSTLAPLCTAVLGLCTPMLSCPDCMASIYRGAYAAGDCGQTGSLVELATGVPVTVEQLDSDLVIENDAELKVAQYRICVDTTLAIDVGMIFECDTTYYQVVGIRTQGSMHCLPEIVARPTSCNEVPA